jgi:hypothetical protein
MKNLNLDLEKLTILEFEELVKIEAGESGWYWVAYYAKRWDKWAEKHFYTEYPAGVA